VVVIVIVMWMDSSKSDKTGMKGEREGEMCLMVGCL